MFHLNDDERAFIMDDVGYKFVPANNNFLSGSYTILQEPRLARMKSIVEHHINRFTSDVCGMKQELVVCQSWIARTLVGGAHSRHNHPNSIFSGVVYLDCSDNSPLNFYHGNMLFKDFKFDVDYDKVTPYNRMVTQLPVSKGDFIMFPSWVEHDVSMNPGPRERVVLAFNTFVRGSFGSYNFYPTGLSV